jgi:hypothetical protein
LDDGDPVGLLVGFVVVVGCNVLGLADGLAVVGDRLGLADGLAVVGDRLGLADGIAVVGD